MALAGAAAAVFGTTLFERGARRPAFADVTSEGAAASNATFAPDAATAAGSFISATLTTGSAVVAAANNGTGPAVQGSAGGTGPGVAGSSAGSGAAVAAVNTGNGAALYASASGAGAAISAISGHGRGAILAGRSVAQLQLTPGLASHPASGQMGDLYADSAGRLWFCKKTGSSATWKQIA